MIVSLNLSGAGELKFFFVFVLFGKPLAFGQGLLVFVERSELYLCSK